ncbi:MAG TPA: CrcB family protein [Myxococcota bacterium]|nr:CrcB family protein [Myxococcota bacterium]
MERLAWVCLGSALGGGARYLISLGALRLLGPAFPYGTLAVNLIGSFLISAIMYVALTTTWISPGMRLFLTTGVMGGFTTYSAFNYETLALATDGEWLLAAINVVVTLAACALAGILGLAVARLAVGH